VFTPSYSLHTLLSTATFGWHWALDVCLYCHNTGRWPVSWHRHRLSLFFDASTRFGKCGQVSLGREETVAVTVFPLWKDTFESFCVVIRVYAVASSNKFNKEERCTQESRPCGAQPFLEGRTHRKVLIISLPFMFTASVEGCLLPRVVFLIPFKGGSWNQTATRDTVKALLSDAWPSPRFVLFFPETRPPFKQDTS